MAYIEVTISVLFNKEKIDCMAYVEMGLFSDI